MAAGGGYSTELMARAVAPNGIVYGAEPARSRRQAQGGASKRGMKTPAMKDVVADIRPFDDPIPPDVHDLDLITFLFYYHDTSYMNVDRAAMDRKMFAALKPGGILVIADHSALPGQGISVNKTLHRIEEATLQQEIEAAGFKHVAEGNFWRNPADTHDFPSYKPTMPVDNFVLKFQKCLPHPEAAARKRGPRRMLRERLGLALRGSALSRRAPQGEDNLLQLILHLIHRGVDAIVVEARRTGSADAADDLVADLDRLAARNGDHVRQRHLLVGDRIGILQLLGVFRRRLLERHRRVGLAPRVLHGVRRGVVAAHLDDRLAVAIDDHGGFRLALGRAGGDGFLGDGLGDVKRQVLVHDQRGAGGRAEQAGEAVPATAVTTKRRASDMMLNSSR